MTRLLRLILALAFAAGAANASAQACAGFADVLATDPLCPSVEWLKNRQVTLGCAAGLYCPNNPVSRLAMAAFMNRLGKALSPEILKRNSGATTPTTLPDDPDPSLVVCQTGDASTATYPRVALLNATFTGLAELTEEVAYRAFWLYSTDGGASFTSILEGNPPAPINSPRASSDANSWSGVALSYALDVDPNLPIRFAVGIRRDNVLTGTNGNFAQWRCQLTAAIMNRNGTSPPY
jgi:hypothetical protein